jgi:hypothetical protein
MMDIQQLNIMVIAMMIIFPILITLVLTCLGNQIDSLKYEVEELKEENEELKST